MIDFIAEQQWIIIAFIFFGIIAYITWVRRQDHKWIDKRFTGHKILALSFGVNYFGIATKPGSPRRSSGFLLLLPDRLFYRSRLKKQELEIPAACIARVYHDRTYKGVNMHQTLLKIDFINSQNEKDTAAFKVPYPPQWILAIENALIKKS